MRFITSIAIFVVTLSWSQSTEKINEIIALKPRIIAKYELKQRPKQLVLETQFNNAIFKMDTKSNPLLDKVILKVELIYTSYAKNENFVQHALNRKRIQALFNLNPICATQEGVEWVLWSQSGCNSAEQGSEFFHGFVITYRDAPNEKLTVIETNFIKDVASGTMKSYAYHAYEKVESTKFEKSGEIEREPEIVLPKYPYGENQRIAYFQNHLKFPKHESNTGKMNVQFTIEKDGKLTNITFPGSPGSNAYTEELTQFVKNMPAWIPGKVNGEAAPCVVQFSVSYMTYGTVVPSPLEIFAVGVKPKSSSLPGLDYSKIKPNLEANLVSKVLSKVDLKNKLIVADVTGSMAPYNAQIIEVIRSNRNEKKPIPSSFVFFNDGNNMDNKYKKVGLVGGIYSTRSLELDSVVSTMLLAMNSGNGGDLEENNLEAVIQGLKAFPESEEVVMIADNFASPRDMILIGQVAVPIHVIVCGGKILNDDYLNIAYQTKGSLSFNGFTYSNLHTLDEGAIVTVGASSFILKNGKFKYKR